MVLSFLWVVPQKLLLLLPPIPPTPQPTIFIAQDYARQGVMSKVVLVGLLNKIRSLEAGGITIGCCWSGIIRDPEPKRWFAHGTTILPVGGVAKATASPHPTWWSSIPLRDLLESSSLHILTWSTIICIPPICILFAFFSHPIGSKKTVGCYNRYKTKKGDSCLDPLFGFGIWLAPPCHWCL
jgi:hypothetical protein